MDGRLLQTLPSPNGLDRWTAARQPEQPGRLTLCALLVAAAHAIVLAALLQIGAPPIPPAADWANVPLIIEDTEPLGTAALSPPAATPQTLSMPPSLIVTTSPATAKAAPHPPVVIARHPPRPPITSPAAGAPRQTQPESASGGASGSVAGTQTAAIPQPAASADDSAALAGLEARIDRAVQAAAFMPDAAKRQHREGRARLRFTYRDGVVDGIEVVESSQSRILDDAALAAVRHAHYPAAPSAARGRRLTLLVWIDFRVVPEES
jgi:protein TonB